MSEANTVQVSIENAVATVTLNRPAKRNAMSPSLHLEMAEVLEKLRYEKTSRVVVVTGAGEAFSAGMDLKAYAAGDTPIITLTNLEIPGLGTFTSRVIIYEGRYAGTWQHGDVGGHLFGRIEKLPAERK